MSDMKCKNCGANLAIDNAFCPYCGTPNKVAQKHRADMKKYATDYNDTKDQVIDKSKRANGVAIKVTAIALTVAAAIGLMFYGGISDSLRRDHARKTTRDNADVYISEMKEYIANEDYLAVDEIARTTGLSRYLRFDNEYRDVLTATSSYADLLSSLVAMMGDNGYRAERLASTISGDIATINNKTGKDANIPEDCKEYAEHLRNDMYLTLNVYLGLNHSEVDELLALSENKRINQVWEAIDEYEQTK